MTKKKRVVAVFTGNRAEYGLQYPILKAIAARADLDYRLIVSGAHLDKNFGRTMAEIRKDGFRVHAEVKIEMISDTLFATANAIGTGIVSMSRALDRIRPDLLVVYADRFEGFAALVAGTQMRIPTAHIEGGDVTEGGALDDSVRHAMTKLAHLHFTTNADAARRIRAMGEAAWRVHDVGFPAIDLVKAGLFASPAEVRARYGLQGNRPVLLFTQHSVTTQFDEAVAQIRPALRALEKLGRSGVQVIATYPNNDAGGLAIARELERWTRRPLPGVQLHKNLGRWNYHGVLNFIGRVSGGACVGNSSSGIKETPAFRCPAVNVGSRQDGRLRAKNLIDIGYDEKALLRAVERCVSDARFLKTVRTCANPYGRGDAGRRIAAVLAKVPLDRRLITKETTI
ncbi:MAG: UDP-N-acetyl-D-glucosamine 2-epimerase, UDP-hydrolysing [Elusimicrobia bacterium RBG_16_66_12]|nr:MAG: UDP-N-acetyl-D-glucosamine 2-epimerase, UDP-hydrolysing [Elusimicrobia bacterium RBG_16_66_12]